MYSADVFTQRTDHGVGPHSCSVAGCSFQSPETEMSGKRLERFWIPPGLRDSLQSFAAIFAGVGSLTFYKSLLNGTSVRELVGFHNTGMLPPIRPHSSSL